MEITRGLVVRALAGRDMGGFFVVLSVDGGYAEIADGKRRRLASPQAEESPPSPADEPVHRTGRRDGQKAQKFVETISGV